MIDHVCYTLSNWDEARVRAAIKAKGLEVSGGRDGSLHVLRSVQLRHPVRHPRSKKTRSGAESGRTAMEGFVAQKLNEFETGKISRRRLIETLTARRHHRLCGGTPAPQADPTLKAQLDQPHLLHLPGLQGGRRLVFEGLQSRPGRRHKQDVAMPFGKKGEQPYGVTAKDVPLTHLIIRTPRSGTTRHRRDRGQAAAVPRR